MKYIVNAIKYFTAAVGIIALCGMCVLIFFQICARYLLANALPWPEELARYCFLVCCYCGICYRLIESGHLRLDIMPLLTGKQKLYNTISLLFTGVYLAVVLYMAYNFVKVVMRLKMKAITVPLPLSWIWFLIILFTLLALVVVVIQLIRCFTNKTTPTQT